MDVAKFEAALELIQRETLRVPLTAWQLEYLRSHEERVKTTGDGEPVLYAMHRQAYVVEVMCDAAGMFAQPGPEAKVAEARRSRYSYADAPARRELFERCVTTLEASLY